MTDNDNDNELIPEAISLWENDGTLKENAIRTLADLNEEYNLILPHYKSEDLVDETFVINALKKVESSHEGQKYYYFAMITRSDGEKCTTVLGGVAVIQILDALIGVGNKSAIQVTLRSRALGLGKTLYTIE